MKVLYMPGLASIIEKDFDFSKSCKFSHMSRLAECHIFDYKKFHPDNIAQYISNFDLLFGSSFGGYFAFYLSLQTGKPSISVNPSLYLDERIEDLKKEHPDKLSFAKKHEFRAIRASNVAQPATQANILMNLDDEVIDAQKVVSVAEKFGCNIYTYEKGGHRSSNFQGDMLPTIKMIMDSIS